MDGDAILPGDPLDDSPWRPNSGAAFEPQPVLATLASPEESPADGADANPPDQRREPARRNRTLIGFGVAALVILIPLAATLAGRGSDVVDPVGAIGPRAGSFDGPDFHSEVRDAIGRDVALARGDAPLVTPTGVCAPRRLPDSVDLLWRTDFPARAINSPVYVGKESVFVIVHPIATLSVDVPSALVALGIDDGQERWRVDLDRGSVGQRLAGVVEGVMIVDDIPASTSGDRRFAGVDVETGELLWNNSVPAQDDVVVDEEAGLLVVLDLTPDPDAGPGDLGTVTVLDPRSGRMRLVNGGDLLGLGGDGQVVTRLGAKVILDDGLLASAVETNVIGLVESSAPSVVVAGETIVTYDGDPATLDVRPVSALPGFLATAVPLTGSGALTPPRSVFGISPLADDSVIVAGDGALHGASIGPSNVEIRWRVDGILVADAPSDRGRSLLVASEGGAVRNVVDASTGRSVVEISVGSGSSAVVDLPANGVLMQQRDGAGSRRLALDLDGREMWSLPGSGRLGVGTGLVVDVTSSTDGLVTVSAYGDEPAQRAASASACGRVVQSWETG